MRDDKLPALADVATPQRGLCVAGVLLSGMLAAVATAGARQGVMGGTALDDQAAQTNDKKTPKPPGPGGPDQGGPRRASGAVIDLGERTLILKSSLEGKTVEWKFTVDSHTRGLDKVRKGVQATVLYREEEGRNVALVVRVPGILVYTVTLSSDRLKFHEGQVEFSVQARKMIDEAVAKAANKSVYFEVDGYTDFTSEYDLRLAEGRAMAVRNYLHDEHGIALDRIDVASNAATKGPRPATVAQQVVIKVFE